MALPHSSLQPAAAPPARMAGGTHAPPGWRADLALRMRRLFLFKLVGTSALVGLFFIAYFALLRNPGRPVYLMPFTSLDRALPFQPTMLYAYLSLWLYVGTAPGLLLTLRELLAYALWATGLALTGLAIFYWWPTAVPALTLDAGHVAGFALLQGVDAPGNACPSLHVAFAVLSFAWIGHTLKRAGAPVLLRLLNLLWLLAITWSTLAIRQHVVLDVVAGAAAGALFAALSLRGPVSANGRERLAFNGATRGATMRVSTPSSPAPPRPPAPAPS